MRVSLVVALVCTTATVSAQTAKLLHLPAADSAPGTTEVCFERADSGLQIAVAESVDPAKAAEVIITTDAQQQRNLETLNQFAATDGLTPSAVELAAKWFKAIATTIDIEPHAGWGWTYFTAYSVQVQGCYHIVSVNARVKLFSVSLTK